MFPSSHTSFPFLPLFSPTQAHSIQSCQDTVRKVVLTRHPTVNRYRSVITLERTSLCGVFMTCWQTQEMCIRCKVWEASPLVLSEAHEYVGIHRSTCLLRFAPSSVLFTFVSVKHHWAYLAFLALGEATRKALSTTLPSSSTRRPKWWSRLISL